jgi:hypothetical protein
MRIEIWNISEEIFKKIREIKIFPQSNCAVLKIGRKKIKIEGEIKMDFSLIEEERYLQFWFRESK